MRWWWVGGGWYWLVDALVVGWLSAAAALIGEGSLKIVVDGC
jgi:hypothetical protein